MKTFTLIVALGVLWVHYYNSTIGAALFYFNQNNCETFYLDYLGFDQANLRPMWIGECVHPSISGVLSGAELGNLGDIPIAQIEDYGYGTTTN